MAVQGVVFASLYRDRHGDDSVLDAIEGWSPGGRVILGEDFNAYHPVWQPGRECEVGRRIAGWLEDRYTLASGEGPTNIHGNTIDLTLTTAPGCQAWVDETSYTGSDHYTLTGTVPLPSSVAVRGFLTYIMALGTPLLQSSIGVKCWNHLWVLVILLPSLSCAYGSCTIMMSVLFSQPVARAVSCAPGMRATLTCVKRSSGFWWLLVAPRRPRPPVGVIPRVREGPPPVRSRGASRPRCLSGAPRYRAPLLVCE